jgi:hypothetical protein
VSTPELDVVDVDRAGRWSQVLLLEVTSAAQARAGAEQIMAAREETPYVAVVSADLGPELPEILALLRPGLQEIVCFDALSGTETGQDLAMRTLDELGFGRDFVFTVPALDDAVDHAVETLLAPEHGGWEGRFVVVLGPRPVIERAHRHLTAPGTA